MNKQPAKYLQTDKRWKSLPYRVKGEDATIGGSGCGPSCAAMLITTLTGKTVTPVDTCKWSVKHGYKALNQGTYYSYFVPQFAEYGIACKQLLASRIINQPKHPIHDQVREYLKQGYYVIALMGPGTWTRSGHFVVLWDWDDKVRINDPASTKSERLNGDPNTFRNEARCYWLVDARNYNKEEDDDMTQEKFNEMMDAYLQSRSSLPESKWSKDEGGMKKMKESKIMDGTAPQSFLTREQFAAVLYRLGLAK